MKKLQLLFVLLLAGLTAQAQIFAGEGLNIPGDYNGFINPPSEDAFRSENQSAGSVMLIDQGTRRWQTTFLTAATGGSATAGSYEWLFTSGPTGNPFANKWANVNVVFDQLQGYVKEGGDNNNVTLTNGEWYTINWQDQGYQNTNAIWMVTSSEPIVITSVSDPGNGSDETPDNVAQTINITLSGTKSAEEAIYLRWSTNNFTGNNNNTLATCDGSGNCTADIPAQPSGTTVTYYVYSTTTAAATNNTLAGNEDMLTIRLNNQGGTNYSYTTNAALPVVLTAFEARADRDVVDLRWSTATEENADRFVVERSSDAKAWEALGEVAAYGNTAQSTGYTYQDARPAAGANYYRLRMVDLDGSYAYSDVRQVTIGEAGEVVILPNPIKGQLTVQHDLGAEALVELYTTTGQRVWSQRTQAGAHNVSELPRGVYVLILSSGSRRVTKKVILD